MPAAEKIFYRVRYADLVRITGLSKRHLQQLISRKQLKFEKLEDIVDFVNKYRENGHRRELESLRRLLHFVKQAVDFHENRGNRRPRGRQVGEVRKKKAKTTEEQTTTESLTNLLEKLRGLNGPEPDGRDETRGTEGNREREGSAGFPGDDPGE